MPTGDSVVPGLVVRAQRALSKPWELSRWARWWVSLSRQLVSAHLFLPAIRRQLLGWPLPQSALPPARRACGMSPDPEADTQFPWERVGGLRGVHAPLPALQSETHPKKTPPFAQDGVNRSLGVCAQGTLFSHSGHLGTIGYTRKAGTEAGTGQPQPPLQRGDTHTPLQAGPWHTI